MALTPDLWRQIEGILQGALAQTPEKRPAFLDQACGDDSALRSRVESMLAGSEDAEHLFERSFVAAPLVAGPQELDPASRVGPYRVTSRLPRGGMGEVYLAEHEELGFRAVIKVVQRNRDTGAIARHFELERHILTRLVHPNIARILDGGSLPSGRPYFVMEFVEGRPIDVYCREEALDLEARLKLFRKVCTAVSYAHRACVAHLDIKPGNLLVTADGEPKLLDFGISRIVDPVEPWQPPLRPQDDEDLKTPPSSEVWATIREVLGEGTASNSLTPEYASPEQWAPYMNIECGPISTPSDIYSLGVLFHELLTGRRPFHGLRWFQLGQAVWNGDPPLPSRAALAGPAEAPETVPSTEGPVRSGGRDPSPADGPADEPAPTHPSMRPQALQRSLRGDLDAILLRAMARTPSLRYASVAEMSEDLRLHLAGLPIRGRSHETFYRVGRLGRHYWKPLLAAALFAVTILGSVVTLTRARAELTAREQALQVSGFLVDQFHLASPDGPEPIEAHRLLDAAASLFESESVDLPDDRAAVYATLGSAYLGLGRYADADPLLRRALDLEEGVERATDTDLAILLLDLAFAERAQGNDPQADRFFRRAVALLQDRRAETKRMAQYLNNRALRLELRGALGDAEVLGREALAMKLRLDPHPQSLARARHNLAGILERTGDYGEAAELLRLALPQREALHGPGSLPVALSYSKLAVLLHNSQDPADHAEAVELARRSLELRLAQNDKPRSIAIGHVTVAVGLGLLGRYEEAEVDLRTALDELAKGGFPPESSSFGAVRVALASCLLEQERLDEAKREAESGLGILIDRVGDGHWRVAEAESVLGGILAGLGRGTEARPLLERGHRNLVRLRGETARPTREAAARLRR